MISYGGKDLASAFRMVRKNTIQVAEDIPESKYSFVAAPEVRSVGRMLTHIAIATRISLDIDKTRHLTTLVGYDFFGLLDRFNAEEAKTRSKAEILELLRTEGGAVCGVAGNPDAGVPCGDGDRARRKNSKVTVREAAWLEGA
jgi:hypothetical protein